EKRQEQTQLIADTEICNDRNWRQRCWSLFEQNYREASFFAEHSNFFKDLYASKWNRLLELNQAIIEYFREELGLTTELRLASELGVYEQGGTQVNLTICREVGADVYLSGSHGRSYLEEASFSEHGIAVEYQEFQHPVYPQLWDGFTSHMSTLDLLLNCGDDSLGIIASASCEAIASLHANPSA
ncbi:MAG: WbqC family protein, partial [Caldilineaceae bacterium]|nr:WbqC family protein [Caldilineaceae bacterium]